jgi:predicted TIM-barrel fold metal-dependent hydrolase
VSEWLARYPNTSVEIGARIGELGRQPRAARKFFDRWQDRIMFGTDAVPQGIETPQQIFNDQLYQIYYRFLETEDEYFDYAPARIPPQGRWKIYGLGLPEKILRKVYHQNAERVLGLRR